MNRTKVAITLEEDTLARIDALVKSKVFSNRSRAIEVAIEEKLSRLERNRLAEECAKFDVVGEQALAEEGMRAELKEWPEY